MKAKVISGQAPGGKRTRLAEVIPLDTPYVVQIFPVYACNFKCNYCIFSVEKAKRHFISDTINMDLNLYKNCIDDIAMFPSKVKVLRFVGIGEPLLHKNIADMVEYAVSKNVADTVEILTNASLLTPKISDMLILSGLQRLVVSVQGTTKEKYRKVCGADIDFEDFIENLKYFNNNKGNAHVYIKIVDTALDSKEDEGMFYDIFGDICDTLAVEHTVPIHAGIDYKNVLKDKEMAVTQFGLPVSEVHVCPQPFFTMQINPDGKVVPCYSFEYPSIMGNCNNQSVLDIWNGKEFQWFRRNMLDGAKQVSDICNNCDIIKYRLFPEDDLKNDAENLKKYYAKVSMDRMCPICFCSEKTFLYKQRFNNKAISLMEEYDVVVCKDCGFVYADYIPSQGDFNKYYAEMSKYEFGYNDGVVSNDYVAHFTKIAQFLTPHISYANAKILDIGCSTGALLSILKSFGYSNLLGIDPSASCVKTVKKLYNIEAIANTISDFHYDEKFDVVILSAVLEHLVDFSSSMHKIRSLLKDQGLLFIEVPDAERFDSYIFTPFQQFSFEHINYFSQYSVKNLLSNYSFEIIDMQKSENRINQTIDPDMFVLSRKLDKHVPQINRDAICESRIRNYISQSSKADSEVKKIIRDKLSNKEKIIVWGIGTFTQRLIGSGLDLSRIQYFVDSNTRYSGKKLKGKEIRSPGGISDEIPILISTYSYQEEVAHQIKEVLKLNNEIIKLYE